MRLRKSMNCFLASARSNPSGIFLDPLLPSTRISIPISSARRMAVSEYFTARSMSYQQMKDVRTFKKFADAK